MTTTTDLDIAVIGGGIGGLSTALALRDRGIDAHVFERTPVLAPIGAAIIVRTQSLDLLRRWSDIDFYDRSAVTVSSMEHFDADGTLLRTTPVIGEPGDPTWVHSVHRADLFETLRRALPEQNLHLGRETRSVHSDTGGAEIVFADGSRVRAKAVIAADGIRSTVRRQLFSQDEPIFSGMVNCRAVLPADVLGDLPNDRPRTWMSERNAFMILPVRGGREVAYDAVFYTDTPGRESWTTMVGIDEVAPGFTGFTPFVQQIIAASPGPISSFSTYDREPIDTWTHGRVALLGDAAHPMLPYQGQGANQAIQDAGALAEHLAGNTDVDVALAGYVRERKPRTDHFQATSRRRPVAADFAAAG